MLRHLLHLGLALLLISPTILGSDSTKSSDSASVQGILFGAIHSGAGKRQSVPIHPTLNQTPKALDTTDDGIWRNVTFSRLGGFDYAATVDPTDSNAGLPPQVLALDGKDVAIEGFMLPLVFNRGYVTEFMLLRNTLACCFGITPKLNEWVYVKMVEGNKTTYRRDTPVKVRGTLRVREKVNGVFVESLFAMDAIVVEELIDRGDYDFREQFRRAGSMKPTFGPKPQ